MTRLLPLLLLLKLPAVVQAQLNYGVNNGAITIVYQSCLGGAVTIPATINVGGVDLPVTSIGDQAFVRCASLTSVTIGNSVTNIGYEAFGWCTRLASVTILDGVTSIGFGAFGACDRLTNVMIGTNVTSIGRSAFNSCSSLTAITVDALNPAYSSVAGVLFDKTQTTLIEYPQHKAGTSYSIPNSVASIGNNAFYYCTSLASVTIPNSVTSVGDWAFEYCTNLTCVTIGTNVSSIGSNAFLSCSSLTNVIVPNSVISIGDFAFCGCTSLTNVTIGTNVTSIGGDAFAGCSSLTNVIIPNSVTSIGSYAFLGCTNLARFTIGNSVTSIGSHAFSNCSNLTSVVIPNSVTRIGSYGFSYCTRLAAAYFAGNAPSADSPNGGSVFSPDINATVYYLPGATGWGTRFGTRPTALWKPQMQASDASFGVRTNQFGFTITWASGMVVVVEACTNLANPVWSPLQPITLTGGSSYFSDPAWTNYPHRFYGLRVP